MITDLDVGGAEIMLHGMLQANLGTLWQEVVCLTAAGPVADRIRKLGVPAHALGMRRDRWSPRKVLRLAGLVRELRPDVVQTWMYHADLLGGLAAKAAGHARIVWGIHNGTLDSRTIRWTTRAVVAACARISHVVPDRIVCVSRAAQTLHLAAGYAPSKFVVIPNGFDLAQFKPDVALRRAVRAELAVPESAVLVGMIARVAQEKDHPTFVHAARALARRAPGVRFLLCGNGATASNEALVGSIRAQGLLDRFLLLGRRHDVASILNALDVATLSSYSEAFPLVIGEAMASGIPCVVTDVGDCAFLVGDTGRVVPPRDPEALARAWGDLLRRGPKGRRLLGVAARARIEAHFSARRIAAEYVELYRRILGETGAGAVPRAQAQ